MQAIDTLTTLFRHHRWANLRLLEACAALTPEQLAATSTGSYGSIRATLEHIVTAEQSYLARISTGRRFPHVEGAPPMTITAMIDAAGATGDGLIEWAPRVQPDDTVEITWDGMARAVPKTILLTQAINHATEHRAQVTALLTQVGIEPPDLQPWVYFDEMDR